MYCIRELSPPFTGTRKFSVLHKTFSADAVTVYFFRQTFLQGIEAFHKVFVLLALKLPGLLLIARPLEPVPGSQFLVQKKVDIAFKEESLDPVAPTSAEKEQCPFLKRVQPELVLDHESEGIDPPAHICISGDNYHAFCTGAIPKHGSASG